MSKRKENSPLDKATQKLEIEELSLSVSGDLSDINKNLRRKIFDLYTIFEISRHLNSMLDVDSLLDAILFTCIGQMGISGAAIVVQDHSSGEFFKMHVKGLSLSDSITWKFSKDGPLARVLQREARPFLAGEIVNKIKGDFDDAPRLRALEAELIVPLMSKGNLLGILFLPRKINRTPFHENDLEFVSILVNQLSVAVDNANLYESERKALLELQSAQQRLLESERLAALGKLSASIAHEVNNPLGIIKNYLTIISRSIPEDKETNSNLEIVREEVDRIAFIVKQLLDFYRPTLKQKIVFDLCDILSTTLDLMKNEFKKSGIEIVWPSGELSCRIAGSREKIKQVFLNLLLNSRDAMPGGGKIEISMNKNEEYVEIILADNGTGIDNDILPNVFEPFYTTKKDSGMGLGLAVCYGIIRSHHGTITVSNNDRGGATFLIKLPVEAPDVRG
ncbi:MAG: ATP-binding protein [candidate division Zixibacteria bacterium]